MVAQKISDKRFEVLSNQYEQEQAELEQQIAQLQTDLDGYDESTDRAEKFLELTKRYKEFTELTPSMLHEFVDRIEVHERADRRAVVTTQKVDVCLNFIGTYSPPTEDMETDEEPDPEAIAAHEKRMATPLQPLEPLTPLEVDEVVETEPTPFYLESDIFASKDGDSLRSHPRDGTFTMNDVTYHTGLTIWERDDTGFAWTSTTVATAIYDVAGLGFTQLTGTLGFANTPFDGFFQGSTGTLIVTCADSGRFLGGADVSIHPLGSSDEYRYNNGIPVDVNIDVSGVEHVKIRLQIDIGNRIPWRTGTIGFGNAFFS